ncbi:MAG: hypothetical protein M1819_006722 [Sarea resinae]|nr:MAG: hypothetical protein M1819_006722 [Sarea resinae]
MLLIRRVWLLPACCVLFIIILAYRRAERASWELSQQTQAKIKALIGQGIKRPENFPVKSMVPLPTGTGTAIPKIQFAFPEGTAEDPVQQERLNAVRKSFKHAWKGYKASAWMKDEVAPISGGYRNTFGGWAATLVDTLDTLWIMGLHDEFEEAVQAVKEIDFTSTEETTLNLFETTIRYLGGLIGAYDVSGGRYQDLLDKAVELGEVLYRAFDTPNRMPVTRWGWRDYAMGQQQKAPTMVLVAEIGSLTLEFTRLSQLTGDPKYYDAIQRITDEFEKNQNNTALPGLFPVVINAQTLSFTDAGMFTIGGMADSLYEYFPKQHLLLNGLTPQYRNLYETSLQAMKTHLFFRPLNKDDQELLFPGDASISAQKEATLSPRAQHLSCFAGGMVALAAKAFSKPRDLIPARKLLDGCVWAYESQPSGLMPEILHLVPCDAQTQCEWDEKSWHRGIAVRQKEIRERARQDDREVIEEPAPSQIARIIKDQRLTPGVTSVDDRRYILRPETIESLFVLYRTTGDPGLRDTAWRMFNAIERATRTKIAHAGLDDVTVVPAAYSPMGMGGGNGKGKSDRMESFWLAETLKYFYLIFAPEELVSLDDFVL